MKKIAHISTVHIRTDTRIFYKEVKSLSKLYDVKLIVADGKGNSYSDSIEIKDLGKPKNRISRILFYGIKAYNLLKKKNIKCVHIHDPELIIIGFYFKIRGFKVIYDIHELVYEDIRTKNWIRFVPLKKAIAEFYKFLEKLAFKFFDAIILAEDGYRSFYEKHYLNNISKVSYIKNYPKKSMFNINYRNISEKKKDKNSLIYLGAIAEDRGIYELIKSMKYLDNTFLLYVIGRWNDSNLFDRCKKLKGWSKVKVLGYLKPTEIGEYIVRSKIGFCTLHKMENFAYTTPVKSFEYLINGLPIIMTDFPFWKEFYNGTALFVNPKNPEDISNAVIKLLKNEDTYNKMSRNGKRLARNHSWENEEKKLFNLYKNLI